MLIAAGMLNSSKATAKTRAIVKTRSNYYYNVERTLNNAVNWLQANSKNLAGGFRTADFEASFELAAPSEADNEGVFFKTPTMIKIKR